LPNWRATWTVAIVLLKTRPHKPQPPSTVC
jgi:hypothetical protein